jgi:hypothetical protein
VTSSGPPPDLAGLVDSLEADAAADVPTPDQDAPTDDLARAVPGAAEPPD